MAGNVTIISGSVGAGHDGVADELRRRLEQRGVTVSQYDFIDLLGRLGPVLRRAYATGLSRAPGTWDRFLRSLERHDRFADGTARLAHRLAAGRTRAALTPPADLVVSVYPVASQVLGRLRERGELAAPVVTFLTDMSVHRLWVSRGVDMHLALHEVPARQALAAGAPVVQVAGAVVRPGFRPGMDATERAATLASYGIPVQAPAALIVAGSWGVGAVLASASDLQATGLVTPVVLCGNNSVLRAELVERDIGVALGWVHDLAPLVRACDVVVQNAGGLSCLEAMACGVPVLSYRCLPGHGQTNAAALEAAGLARWPRDRTGLADALTAALAAPRTVPALVTADPADQLMALLPRVPAIDVPA